MSNGHKSLTLFIGGSSCLARSFVNLLFDEEEEWQHHQFLLSGVEESPPAWLLQKWKSSSMIAGYVQCDLTTVTGQEQSTKLLKDCHSKFGEGKVITRIILGVRPVLLAPYDQKEYSNAMLRGIQTLLECVSTTRTKAFGDGDGASADIKFVLHISSVAAVDHMKEQSFVSEEDEDRDILPPISDYQASYDIFKRQSEDIVSSICKKANIHYCHLRLSAIFSDDPKCIQCSALQLQCRIGSFLPNPIDCNSSRNVSRAILAILDESAAMDNADGWEDKNDVRERDTRNGYHSTTREKTTKVRTLYYYTRPLHLKQPVPYGYYLQEYRKAYQLQHSSIWIPAWVVTWFVIAFHWILSSFGLLKNIIPYLNSADYLLQVSSREHSFDNSKFSNDFRHHLVDNKEESIYGCFIRRKLYLSNPQDEQIQPKHKSL